MHISLKVVTSAIALACATSASGPAQADGSAFVGGLVGGIVGSAIANAPRNQPQVQTRTVYRRAAPAPVVNTYERQQNREVQTALNYFGFPAGSPDGVMGPNSRSAVAQFQGMMGYPSTGYINEYERAFLASAYNRALVGGPQVQQMMASYGQGPRGLLLAFRAEQSGQTLVAAPLPVPVTPLAPLSGAPVIAAPVVAAPVVEAAAPAPAAPAPVPAPAPIVEAAAPMPELAVEAEAAPAGLPSFLAATAEASMASHCNRVSLVTSTNGGFVTVSNLVDPAFALEEQFCLARTYAIEDGDRIAATVEGVSAGDIRAQCEAFAPAMRPYLALLGGEGPNEVVEQVRGFIVQTGASPAQIAGNARICLSVGYRTDNAELALGSAVMLEAAGEAAYGEHVGHHLMQGFGVSRRGDRAVEWLTAAIDAMEQGASPVVSPGTPERVALLRRSLDMATGTPGEVLSDAAAPATGLPGFVLPTAPATASN